MSPCWILTVELTSPGSSFPQNLIIFHYSPMGALFECNRSGWTRRETSNNNRLNESLEMFSNPLPRTGARERPRSLWETFEKFWHARECRRCSALCFMMNMSYHVTLVFCPNPHVRRAAAICIFPHFLAGNPRLLIPPRFTTSIRQRFPSNLWDARHEPFVFERKYLRNNRGRV